MKNLLFLVTLIFSTVCGSSAQEVIPLYDGKIPPGSDRFTLEEKVRTDENGEIVTIRNVSMPTLTVYEPEEGKNNGTAIIIAVGGAFQGLAVQAEGTPTVKWCVDNGITAFILKYRLIPHPSPEFNNAKGSERDSLIALYVGLAAADGLAAVKYVRTHAANYGIDSEKIGMIGYSAGGTVVGSVSQTYSEQSRPDFLASIYGAVDAMVGDKVPADAPPLFLAWATNDPVSKGNPGLYVKWRDAGKSVEMHAFYSGGHGFSLTKHGKPSDTWSELFREWMVNQGFLTK